MKPMSEAVRLTQELVRIESTNPGAQEFEIAEYILGYLSGCGAKIRVDEVSKGRRNLLASLEGEKTGESLIMVCHMDTVVIGEGWTVPALSGIQNNGRIYGRGSCDMKSGLACALSAFKKTAVGLNRGEIKLKRPVRLLCTVDEEGDMQGAEQAVRKGFISPKDWIMDLEPTDGQIQMAHKGRLWLAVNIQGITAHASRPQQGADAVAAAGELICRLRGEFAKMPVHEELGRPTVTFGKIEGGYQPYVVPDTCRVWMDMRLVPPMNSSQILEITDRIIGDIEKEMAGISIHYDVTGNRPCIERSSVELLKAVKEACLDAAGKMPKIGAFSGYTDTAVIAGLCGSKEFLSYGPGSLNMAHKPDEYVEIADIERCEKVLFSLIERTAVVSSGTDAVVRKADFLERKTLL